MDLYQWFSIEDDFAMFGDIFGCYIWGTAAGIWWVAARNVAGYPAMHGIAPTAENYLTSNVNSAKLEKS